MENVKEQFIKYCREHIQKEKGIMLTGITFPDEEDDRLFFSCTKEEFIKQFITENASCYSYNQDYDVVRDFDDCLECAFDDFYQYNDLTKEEQLLCEQVTEEDIFK